MANSKYCIAIGITMLVFRLLPLLLYSIFKLRTESSELFEFIVDLDSPLPIIGVTWPVTILVTCIILDLLLTYGSLRKIHLFLVFWTTYTIPLILLIIVLFIIGFFNGNGDGETVTFTNHWGIPVKGRRSGGLNIVAVILIIALLSFCIYFVTKTATEWRR